MSGILVLQAMMDVINIILTRGVQDNSVSPCSPGWECPRIKVCTMADTHGVSGNFR
jgi:hypothetical protein